MTSYPSAPPPGSGSYGSDAGAGQGPGSYPPEGASGGPPVCARHRDRVSYITCQRCKRPACPECQRPAAVGVHCVDCVAQAQRSAPRERTITGARASRSGRPVVTITMMVLCVGLHLLWMFDSDIRAMMIFWPGVGGIEPWRMLTTAFLHANWIHLAVNMYALWIVGPFLEKSLGTWRYLSLYLVSALGGSVAVVLLTPLQNWGIPVVGASGAVFGLFAACALMLRRLGGDARQILIVIAINVVISFTLPRISWQGHFGGMVVGALLTALFIYLPKKHRTVGAVVGVVLAITVLLGATWAVYA